MAALMKPDDRRCPLAGSVSMSAPPRPRPFRDCRARPFPPARTAPTALARTGTSGVADPARVGHVRLPERHKPARGQVARAGG